MASLSAALHQIGYLDTLASGDTPLHRLDPRAKLLATAAYVLAVVSFGKYEISAMLPFALYPLCLAAAGAVPLSFVARNSRCPIKRSARYWRHCSQVSRCFSSARVLSGGS